MGDAVFNGVKTALYFFFFVWDKSKKDLCTKYTKSLFISLRRQTTN